MFPATVTISWLEIYQKSVNTEVIQDLYAMNADMQSIAALGRGNRTAMS